MVNRAHVAIVGAGPAGLACAKTLGDRGITFALFDPRPGGWPADGFVLVETGESAIDLLRRDYEREIALCTRLRANSVVHRGREWRLRCEDGSLLAADTVVIATGLQVRSGGFVDSPRIIVGPTPRAFSADYAGHRVAILGGGDNAFEYASIALERGADRATIFARGIRATAGLRARAKALGAEVFGGASTLVAERGDAVLVDGVEFDLCLVMFGFAPRGPVIKGRRGRLHFAGDIANPGHPRFCAALQSGEAVAREIAGKRGKYGGEETYREPG